MNQYATLSPSGETRGSKGPLATSQSPPTACIGSPSIPPSVRRRTKLPPFSATIVPSSAIDGELKPPLTVSRRSKPPSGVASQRSPSRTSTIELAPAGAGNASRTRATRAARPGLTAPM